MCLAVQDGTLVLFYDFGSGLKRADPLQPPQALTAASKAVRQGTWGQEDQRRNLAFLRPTTYSLQIQVFLLAGARKRVLVRVERATVFSIDQDNELEMAEAYYLGGVPPEELPPR